MKLEKILRGEMDSDNKSNEKIPILAKNTDGVNRSGFWGAGGVPQWVIGAAGKKVQYQQGDGSQENM
jgi:hypothetical protein